MFRENVTTSTAMTNTIADEYFADKIPRNCWNSDYSFVATLRAVIAPRMGEDDKLFVQYCTNNYGHEYESKELENIRNEIAGEVQYYCDGDDDVLLIAPVFSSSPKVKERVFAALSDGFMAEDGFEHLKKNDIPIVDRFFEKTMSVRCYVNRERRATIVFVEAMNAQKHHYLQCAVFNMLPWYNRQDMPITEQEIELIKCMRDKGAYRRYIELLTEFSHNYDFRTSHINKLLSGYETRTMQSKLSAIQGQSEYNMRQQREHVAAITNLIRQRDDLLTQIAGLEARIRNGDTDGNEVMEYFLHRKDIELIDVCGQKITFAVKTKLQMFDRDAAKHQIRGFSREARPYDSGISCEEMEKLLTALFVDEVLTINVCAAYEVSLDGVYGGISGFCFDDYAGYENYMPNTHIQQYSCLGSANAVIAEILANGEMIGAVEQLAATAKNLNFKDTTVLRRFVESLYRMEWKIKIINLPDGTIVGVKEAIEWLNQQGGEERNEQKAQEEEE